MLAASSSSSSLALIKDCINSGMESTISSMPAVYCRWRSSRSTALLLRAIEVSYTRWARILVCVQVERLTFSGVALPPQAQPEAPQFSHSPQLPQQSLHFSSRSQHEVPRWCSQPEARSSCLPQHEVPHEAPCPPQQATHRRCARPRLPDTPW